MTELSDDMREIAIRELTSRMEYLWANGDHEEAHKVMAERDKLIRERSPAQVKRMEAKCGLA